LRILTSGGSLSILHRQPRLPMSRETFHTTYRAECLALAAAVLPCRSSEVANDREVGRMPALVGGAQA